MRSETLLRRPLRLLLIIICFLQAANSHSQPGDDRSVQIKKIYIEAVANVKEEIRIDPYLKAELEKRGFQIVDDAAKADAILSLITAQGEIVLHSAENVPHKSIYQYQLALPDKKIIWKSKLKFISKPSFTEEQEYVAGKFAEKIAKKFGAKK
jgi:hypothetical protein